MFHLCTDSRRSRAGASVAAVTFPEEYRSPSREGDKASSTPALAAISFFLLWCPILVPFSSPRWGYHTPRRSHEAKQWGDPGRDPPLAVRGCPAKLRRLGRPGTDGGSQVCLRLANRYDRLLLSAWPLGAVGVCPLTPKLMFAGKGSD